jgi:hypothetical protein
LFATIFKNLIRIKSNSLSMHKKAVMMWFTSEKKYSRYRTTVQHTGACCVVLMLSYLCMKFIPFLLLEYSYVQRGPIHVCQIYQSKPVDFQFSEIIQVNRQTSQKINHWNE